MRSAVLAGGTSSRFGGRPKGLERIGGVRLLDQVVAALTDAVREAPLIIANDPNAGSWRTDLTVVADVLPGQGALGGILTAVLAGHGPVLVLAWDMPFVSPDLLRALAARAGAYDVYLPESSGPRGVEPLCGVYAAACADPIRRNIAAGRLQTTAFHDAVRTGRMPLATVRTFGEPDVLFLNVNAPADLAAAALVTRRRASPPGAPPGSTAIG